RRHLAARGRRDLLQRNCAGPRQTHRTGERAAAAAMARSRARDLRAALRLQFHPDGARVCPIAAVGGFAADGRRRLRARCARCGAGLRRGARALTPSGNRSGARGSRASRAKCLMSAHLPAPPKTARHSSRASRAGHAPAWSSERTLLQAEGRESRIAFVVSGVLGALYALWLYGVRVVDPTSVHWLLHGDAAQHFIGLSYFLVEPWHWPLGAIRRFGSDPTSVVFTDSIPLLALPAKALGMPSGTQYFGIWMLACHALV